MSAEVRRRFLWPLGALRFRRPVVYRTANPAPWFGWNRYPGQVIGFAFRIGEHRVVSVVWAKPARYGK